MNKKDYKRTNTSYVRNDWRRQLGSSGDLRQAHTEPLPALNTLYLTQWAVLGKSNTRPVLLHALSHYYLTSHPNCKSTTFPLIIIQMQRHHPRSGLLSLTPLKIQPSLTHAAPYLFVVSDYGCVSFQFSFALLNLPLKQLLDLRPGTDTFSTCTRHAAVSGRTPAFSAQKWWSRPASTSRGATCQSVDTT